MATKRPIYANDDLPGDAPMDVFSMRMSVLGTLLHGETSGLLATSIRRATVRLNLRPLSHDRFDIWIASEDGDAVAWVLDTNFHALAWTPTRAQPTRTSG